jgi:DNA mismatch repair ATPase MutL
MQLNEPKTANLILNNQNLVYHGVSELINKFLNEVKSLQLDPNFTSKSSYSINDMSEDEEDEEEQNARRRPQGTSAAASALTRDFFSAVLASINQNQPRQEPLQTQGQPSQQQEQQASGLNRDYFHNVMSQLLGQSAPTQTTPGSAVLTDEVLAQRLEQLHEFGFWDDEKNVRALQLTNGDVEAAINLMVEGVDF